MQKRVIFEPYERECLLYCSQMRVQVDIQVYFCGNAEIIGVNVNMLQKNKTDIT